MFTLSRRFRPKLVSLEDRTVPSASMFGDTFNVLENSTLTVPAAATQITETGNGEITLPAASGSEFFGPGLPADWQVISWSSTGTGSATVGGGVLTVDGAQAGTSETYTSGRTLNFTATFDNTTAFQHVGFGIDFGDTTPWMIFSTREGGQLYARTYTGAGSLLETQIPGNWLGSAHNFQIDWTPSGATFSIDDTTVATHDLSISTPLCLLVGDYNAGGGSLVVDSMTLIPPGYQVGFEGTSLPPGWSSTAASVASVNLGQLTVDGGLVGPQVYSTSGGSLEFRATFSGAPFQHVGLGTDLSGSGPWMIFSTGPGGVLLARTSDGVTSMDTPLPGTWLGSSHDFKIDWKASGAIYSIDGIQLATHSIPIGTSLRPIVSDLFPQDGAISVDWMRMSPFSGSGGFLSRVFDAGSAVSWTGALLDASTPTSTGATLLVRTGNTATPEDSWTEFAPLSGVDSSTYRFAQYRIDLATADPNIAPVVQSVMLTTSGSSFTDTTVADFAMGVPGLGILADDGPPANGPYTAILGTNVSHGSLTFNPDGSFAYAPNADFVGTDSFVYRARGADGSLSDPHTVTLAVFDANTPPTLTVNNASGIEGSAIPLDISATLTSTPGSQTLTVTVGGLPAGATLSHGTFAAGVWTLTPTDLTGLTFTAPDNGSYDLNVTAIAQSVVTGTTSSTTATLVVEVANVAPSAMISTSGTVTYGNLATVQLASPFDPSTADTFAGLHYAFSLNAVTLDSANYDTGSGETASASFSLDAGTYTVYARIIDKDGGYTPYQIKVNVNKAVVTVAADAKGMVYGSTVPTLTASYNGFVNGDSASSLSTPVSLTTTATRTSTVGSYPIIASGVTAANYTFVYVPGELTVTSPTTATAFVAPDPVHPGSNALFISGTDGADNILVAKADVFGTTGVVVYFGGTAVKTFTGQFSRIVVHGQAGDDDVLVLGPSSVSSWIYGDDGNDRLHGGSDNNVLLGGDGNDLLAGGAGRDLLIGGKGEDRILGGGGDDLLIGGTTTHDSNETALSALQGIWVGGGSFSDRVARISNTAAQYNLIQGVSVLSDDTMDVFFGNGGSDLFLAESEDWIADLSTSDKAFIAG